MNWFNGLFNGGPKTPEVLAAEDKVKSAQAELEEAKKAAADTVNAPASVPAADGNMTSNVGGRRRKSRKTRRAKKSKRSRTGRKSSHP